MPYGKELLTDSRIRELCLAALADVNKLDTALEEIYRRGFVDTPQMKDAPKLFVERLKAVRTEFCTQLQDYLDNHARWKLRQLDIAEDPGAMASGVSLLAALARGSKWEQAECYGLLNRRMAAGSASRENDRAVLELFADTPMTAVFTGGQMPRVPEENTTQVAGILAMCTYVTIKRDSEVDVLPELSFDVVCIWSNAMTEALLRPDGPSPEAVATVCCVMATQYMHIAQWEVLKAGLESLYSLSYPVMGKILDNIRLELLAQEEDQCLVEWVWLEERPFRYDRWLKLLRQQENLSPSSRMDEDEEALEDYIQKEKDKNRE